MIHEAYYEHYIQERNPTKHKTSCIIVVYDIEQE